MKSAVDKINVFICKSHVGNLSTFCKYFVFAYGNSKDNTLTKSTISFMILLVNNSLYRKKV